MLIVAHIKGSTTMRAQRAGGSIGEIEVTAGLFPVQLRLHDKDGARKLIALLKKYVDGQL